ncbi:MAG: membrane fusion protein (multidrug efflux system) [Candidatus Azotimanducaceae bacterium]|jgi:membrane fusion protein (multidrug efflux system)
MMQRMIIMLLSLAVVFGGIFGWKAWQQEQRLTAMASRSAPLVTVSSAEVQSESWRREVGAVGSLTAIQGVDVSPEVAGVVADISFESGSRISADAVMVQLNATAEKAELRSLQARVVLARQDYDRAKGLAVKTALSQAQLDRAQSVLDSLVAQAEEQEALIARKTIRAPFGGELGIREINLGEYLSPGTGIVTLQRLTPILLDFTLPEKNLHLLAPNQRIEISLAAVPGDVFIGRLTAISPKVEAATRNVRLQATLQNVEGRLRPGMFAQVAVITGDADTVKTLPRTAVEFLPYGNSVFVIERAGERAGEREADDKIDTGLIVRRKQVQTGRVQGNRIEILGGLELGQLVVSSGQLKLRNGQKIRIDNSVETPTGLKRG